MNIHPGELANAGLKPFFQSPTNSTLVVFAAIAAAVSCLPLIYPHDFYIATMFHDCLFIADLGYRLVNGQVPHMDFISPIGLAFMALIAAGTHFSSNVIESLRDASYLAAILTLPIVLYVAKTRLSSGCAFLLISICLLTLIVPVNIGDPSSAITYASLYNRLSYVLILLVILLAIGETDGNGGLRILDHALIALIVGILAYTKVNYGVFSLLFLAFWGVYRGSWAPLAWSAICVVGAALALEVFVKPGINSAYFHDLQLAINSGGSLRLWAIKNSIQTTRIELFLSVVAIPLVSRAIGLLKDKEMLPISCIYAIGLLLIAQTGQAEGLFVVLAPSFVLVSRLRRKDALDVALPLVRGRNAQVLLLIVAVLGISASYIIRPALASVGQLTAVRSSSENSIRVGDIVTLRGLVLNADGNLPLLRDVVSGNKDAFHVFKALRFSRRPAQYLGQDEYLESIRDGVRLLDNHPQCNAVMTLDFANPFPIIRATQPAGGMAWFHYRRTFTEQHFPSEGRLFRGVDCLMIPRLPVSNGETMWLLRIYGPYIKDHFSGRAESPFWVLLTR